MFKIYTDHQKITRTVCSEVEKPYSEDVKKTVREMVDYLRLSQDDEYAKKHGLRSGVGLAAPQIGIAKRMIAIYLEDGDTLYQFGLINPKVERTSLKEAYLRGGEGCLSVNEPHPGIVNRYYKVVVSAYDVLTEKDVTITAYGYLAICLQHEIDHLDGVLFYDRIDKEHPFEPAKGAIAV